MYLPIWSKPSAREARIEIEFANPEGLFKPGMFINIQIEFVTHKEATVVPVSSVVKREGQQGVFLADTENNIAQFVPVKVGISTNELVEIIESATIAGQVVTLGQHLLADGSPVILSEPSSLKESEDAEKKKPGEKK